MKLIIKALKKSFLFPFVVHVYEFLIISKKLFIILFQLFFKRFHSRPVFFFPFFHTGGAEKVHLDIVKAVCEFRPIVFFTGKSYNEHFKEHFKNSASCFEINGFVSRNNILFNLVQKLIIIKLNRSYSSKVFICNSLFGYSIIPKLKNRIKIIDLIHAFTHEHEPGAEKWSIPVVASLYKRVVICKAVKNMLLEQYKKNNISIALHNKIEVIYNYVDLAETIDLKSRNKLPFTVLFVGRNSPEKQVEDIIAAAKILTKNNDVKFQFIGPGLESLAESNANKKIQFIGNLSAQELSDHYKSSHVIILMSSREGLPVVLMEAMALGVVPVSTNVGGIPELISHGKTGFLIESNLNHQERINKAVEHIHELLQNNQLLIEFSKNASCFVTENFSKEQFDSSFRKLLK